MSYVRWSEHSDVYVFEERDDPQTLCCCSCSLADDRGSFHCEGEAAMLAHLHAHVAAGHKVPAVVIETMERNVNTPLIVGFDAGVDEPFTDLETLRQAREMTADEAVQMFREAQSRWASYLLCTSQARVYEAMMPPIRPVQLGSIQEFEREFGPRQPLRVPALEALRSHDSWWRRFINRVRRLAWR